WESNWQYVIPASHPSQATQGGFHIGPNVIMEAINNTFVQVGGAGASFGSVSIETIHASGQIGVPDYCLRLLGGSGGTYSMPGGGGYHIATFDIEGAGSAKFISCSGANDPDLNANAS